jgi:hypothetical protein
MVRRSLAEMIEMTADFSWRGDFFGSVVDQ